MRWDSNDRRYEDSDGRPLTPAEVRKHIEEFIESEKAEVQAESKRLFARAITVAAFFDFMRQKVTAWHSTAGQMAYGGESQMGRDEWKRINEKILSELEYLNGFAEATENSFAAAEAIGEQTVQGLDVPDQMGPVVSEAIADALLQSAPSEAEDVVKRTITAVLADTVEDAGNIAAGVTVGVGLASLLIGGTVEGRAQLYTDSTFATYENSVIERERSAGVTHGRRVEEGDQQVCEDCQAAATEEFIPLDEIVEIGDSICTVNCRCFVEYHLSELESDLSNVDEFRIPDELEEVFRV